MGFITHDDHTKKVIYTIASKNIINEAVVPLFDTYKFYGNKLTNYIIWK